MAVWECDKEVSSLRSSLPSSLPALIRGCRLRDMSGAGAAELQKTVAYCGEVLAAGEARAHQQALELLSWQ